MISITVESLRYCGNIIQTCRYTFQFTNLQMMTVSRTFHDFCKKTQSYQNHADEIILHFALPLECNSEKKEKPYECLLSIVAM